MKYFSIIPLFLFALAFNSIVPASFATQTSANEGIEWMSFEEAMEATTANPKLIFIDVYTDWCGYCKLMDKSTFIDPAIVEVLNENFYAVKLNAEQKEDIQFDGHTFKYVPNGRRGYHAIAASLLDQKLSYPSFVYLDKNKSRISISPGYKNATMMLKELHYIAGEHYKTLPFDKYEFKPE